MRLGSWNIVMFLTYEQLKRAIATLASSSWVVAEQEVNNILKWSLMASCRVVKLCLNYLREIQNTSFDVLSEGPSSDYIWRALVFSISFSSSSDANQGTAYLDGVFFPLNALQTCQLLVDFNKTFVPNRNFLTPEQSRIN